MLGLGPWPRPSVAAPARTWGWVNGWRQASAAVPAHQLGPHWARYLQDGGWERCNSRGGQGPVVSTVVTVV